MTYYDADTLIKMSDFLRRNGNIYTNCTTPVYITNTVHYIYFMCLVLVSHCVD